MTFGLTPQGFNTKRLADVIEEAEENLSTLSDPSSGQTLDPDFSSNDPGMQLVKVPLDGVAEAWAALQLVADQYDPNNASGPLLASLVQLNGITKDDGTPSTAPVLLTGTVGTLITKGQLVTDEEQANFWTTDTDVILDGSGQGTTTVSSQVLGAVAAPVGTINTISTSVDGWSTVSNTAAATAGETEESDENLRTRRSQSTLAPSATPAESLWANIRNLTGVSFVRVLSNRTLVTDANGIPGKSIAAVVVGGDDTEVAKVLLSRTSDAANWHGTTTINFTDQQGEPYSVSFIRPSDLDIFVEVDVTVTNTGVWPSNGADKIKQAIVTYSVEGAPGLGIDDGFKELGFLPGVDIETSRLYTPINSVPGHRITGLRVGTSASPSATVSIPVAFNQQSRFDTTRIVVNVS